MAFFVPSIFCLGQKCSVEAPLSIKQKFAFSNSSTAAAVASGGSGLKASILARELCPKFQHIDSAFKRIFLPIG